MKEKKYFMPSSVVANTAAALVQYKHDYPFSITPMNDLYKRHVSAFGDDDKEFDRYFRVARALGWRVKRKGANYYENGIFIR